MNRAVSVVMSVYNGADALPATLASILNQEGCAFEFIVINDGSSDESGRILDQWAARDARLRVIHQANTGLTRALIRGCAEARGEFIARQDCGDVSLAGRLASQVAMLRGDASLVMVACGAQFVGPDGELLHEVIREGDRLHEGLSVLQVARIVGPPHHGGTMFRCDSYHKAGGYRHQFVVAQDIDLWLRLAERGKCAGQAVVYYRASIEAASISGRRRDEQLRLAELATECAHSRRNGVDDQPLVEAFTARTQPRAPKGAASSAERARYYYYLGAMLRKKQPQVARRYFRRALREQPFHLKAFWRSVWG